jgi:membrane-bound lytic murein transglycosylase D
VDERRDPEKATKASLTMLSRLHDMFGDWYLALAAYNAGEGKIKRALEITKAKDFFELSDKNNRIRSYRRRLRTETKHYVPKFIAVSKIFQNLDTLGFTPVRWDQAPDLAHAQVAGGTDLLALSRACDMSWKEFHAMNPAFRRQVSPPDKTCTVHVPAERMGKLVAYLSDPESRPFAGYHSHVVRRGDCWYDISRRYGVPISVLKQVNNRRSNLLKPGQRLMVPAPGSSRGVAGASGSSGTAKRTASSSGSYTVRKGDTLWSISRSFRVSLAELKQTNNLSSSRLRVGQKLAIPGLAEDAKDQGKTRRLAQSRANYIVQRGDTLWSISRSTGVSVGTLVKANGLSSANRLSVGQKLYIPDGSGTATAQNRKAAGEANRELVQYKVRKGDNLWTISRRFGVSTSQLKQWNELRGSSIHPGDNLKVYVIQ